MNLISCSNCGVVIDRDRIPEQETYEPDGSRKNVTWCRECFELTGIIPPIVNDQEKVKENKLSLEDMIREIVREEAENLNRRFAELAGICWHEAPLCVSTVNPAKCSCGFETFDNIELRLHTQNPDFTDAREVLRVINDKGLLDEFCRIAQSDHWMSPDEFVEVYILDTTGRLRDLAIKFMEERK